MDDIEIDGRLWRPVALRPPKKRDWYTIDMKWVYRSGCALIQTALIVEPVEPESPLADWTELSAGGASAKVEGRLLHLRNIGKGISLHPIQADKLCALWAEHKEATSA